MTSKLVFIRCPLRLPLGGGGTDLPSFYSKYSGFLTSAAIDKYVYVLLQYNPFAHETRIFIEGDHKQEVTSYRKIHNILLKKTIQYLPYNTRHLKIISFSDVPFGTGLGSSSSFVSALLKAFHVYNNTRVSRHQLAEQAYYIEAILAKRPIGKHDQYISIFGGLTSLNIQKDGGVKVKKLNLPKQTLALLQRNILLFYTGIRRDSSVILTEQQYRVKRNQAQVIESMKKIKEIGKEIVLAIKNGEYDNFGKLLHKHWETKKCISNRITNKKINKWYSLALQNGALGGKIIGPGGGGFLMLYCPSEKQNHLKKILIKKGLIPMQYNFDPEGIKVICDF